MMQVLRPPVLRNSPWNTIGATGTKKRWPRKRRKTRSRRPGGLRAPRTRRKQYLRPRPKKPKAAPTIGAWVVLKLSTRRAARDGSRKKKRRRRRAWKLSHRRRAVVPLKRPQLLPRLQ